MTVVNPKSISGINSITTGSGSDNLLTIHTSDANNTERLRVNSSGDVIVGSGVTLSPDGDAFFTGVTTSTTLNVDDKIVHTGDTNTALRFPAADTITAETSGTERLRITSNGDIVTQGLTNYSFNNDGDNTKVFEVTGDGTVGEYGVINISGNQNADDGTIGIVKFINRENSSSSSGDIAGGRQIGSIEMRTDTGDTNAGDDCGGYFRFITKADGGGNSERLRITSAGLMGLGTNDPTGTLSIASGTFQTTTPTSTGDDIVISGNQSLGMQFLTLASGTSNNNIYFGDTDDPDVGMIRYAHSNNSMQFRTNTGERLRISSVGQLTHTYDISSNGDAGLILDTDDGTKASSILFRANTENRARIDVQRLAGDGGQLKIQVAQMDNSNTLLDAVTIAPVSSGDTTPDVTLTGNLKFASSGGINFHDYGSGTNVDSNLLDDYEEGTWTPSWGDGGGAGGLTNISGCTYVKIGELVHVRGRFTLSSTSGNVSTVDGWYVTGLPFSNSDQRGSAGSWWMSSSWTSGTRATGLVMAYGTTMYFGTEYESSMARGTNNRNFAVTYRTN